jgi:hypothetical protein
LMMSRCKAKNVPALSNRRVGLKAKIE